MADPDHLNQRTDNGIYSYVRRVPTNVSAQDKRGTIRISLKTRDHSKALIMARGHDQANNALWSALLAGDRAPADSWEQYEASIALSVALGYAFKPMDAIVTGPSTQLLARMDAARGKIDTPAQAKAILGGVGRPQLSLSGLWLAYWRHKLPETAGMSPSQLKKHRLPRQRAIKYLIEQIGDKRISEIDRADALQFRGFWAEKIKDEDLTAYAANRCFSDIKGMLTVIDSALQTQFNTVWAGIRIKATQKTRMKTRPAFSDEFIQHQILAPGALDCLNFEARMIFYATIETGLRPGEVANARAEDIILGAEIPLIRVAIRDDRWQKTDNSVREIPLVGVSLWALEQCPKGFLRYFDKSDSLSATVNKALKIAGLRPTPDHTAYSMRHSFQDRILAAEASNRLQSDLMGHEFNGTAYGAGASLEQKLKLLDSIKFDWPQ